MNRNAQLASFAGLLAVSWILGSATLVRKGSELAVSTARAPLAQEDASAPDPDRMAQSMWTTKIHDYYQTRAVDFTALQAAIAKDPGAAGARYGHRGVGEDARWNFVTRIEGTVLQATLGAPVPTLEVDTNGDGKPDAIVQCGPVFEGSSLRDALDFISFATVDSQIAYGEFGTALNDLAYANVTRDKCADAAPGRRLAVTGAFTHEDTDALPVVTPAGFEWSAAK